MCTSFRAHARVLAGRMRSRTGIVEELGARMLTRGTRQSHADLFRPLRRGGAVLLIASALVGIDVLALAGVYGLTQILVLASVSIVAALLGGWDIGVGSAIISLFYCLHAYSDPGQAQLIYPHDKIHLVETALGIATAMLVVSVLRQRALLQQRELAARTAAEAARLSEERFHIAMRAAPIIVFSQDRELRYISVPQRLPNKPAGLRTRQTGLPDLRRSGRRRPADRHQAARARDRPGQPPGGNDPHRGAPAVLRSDRRAAARRQR